METIWLADWFDAAGRRVAARPVVAVIEIPGFPRRGGHRAGGSSRGSVMGLRFAATGETGLGSVQCPAPTPTLGNKAQALTTRALFLVGVTWSWCRLSLLGGRDRARERAARCGRGRPYPVRQPGVLCPHLAADRSCIGRGADASRDRRGLAGLATSGLCNTFARGSARLGPLGAAPSTRALAARGGRDGPDVRRDHARTRLGGWRAQCARAPGFERHPHRARHRRGLDRRLGGFLPARFG